MPPAPELGHRVGDIWIVKVFRIVEAEHPAHTNCHIRVGGKVVVQLQRIQQSAKPRACRRQAMQRGIQILPDQSTRNIGDHDLLAQTDAEAGDALAEILHGGGTVFNFSRYIAVTDNRACHQLMIAGQVHQIAIEAALCRHRSPIDIHHIADSLEGVERNADGQRNPWNRQRQPGNGIEIFHKKSAVFKDSEHPQIKAKGSGKRKLHPQAVPLCAKPLDTPCPTVIQQGSQDEHKHPDRLSPRIKDQGKAQKHHISPRLIFDRKV